MTDLRDLSALLNWKLLAGGHRFPGPDGGTCINEAAIVVAGFEYRNISMADDCPPCFSRPISAYALKLNDRMPDSLRQELLMPFVTRLAGTTDSAKIEGERGDLIVVLTVNDILPVVLRLHGLEDRARLCERARTRAEAYAAADKAYDALRGTAYAAATAARCAADCAAYVTAAATAAECAAECAGDCAADCATAAARTAYAAECAAECADLAAPQHHIWIKATHILDSALRIGKQAEPIETSVIIKRADAAKQIARVV